ncbi:hypothetical protein FRC08_013514, partial [Ceratobasidium sp. 394]
CCASGRILNNSVKLVGAGFRGPESKGIGDKIRDAIPGIRRWRKNKPPPEEDEKMEEGIPDVEREMDSIKADTFTWTACHQRQDSVNYPDLKSGLFTRLWTEALDKDTTKSLRIGKLFEDVSTQTLELGKKEDVWQYVQLWTSTGSGDKEFQAKILQKPVDI